MKKQKIKLTVKAILEGLASSEHGNFSSSPLEWLDGLNNNLYPPDFPEARGDRFILFSESSDLIQVEAIDCAAIDKTVPSVGVTYKDKESPINYWTTDFFCITIASFKGKPVAIELKEYRERYGEYEKQLLEDALVQKKVLVLDKSMYTKMCTHFGGVPADLEVVDKHYVITSKLDYTLSPDAHSKKLGRTIA